MPNNADRCLMIFKEMPACLLFFLILIGISWDTFFRQII